MLILPDPTTEAIKYGLECLQTLTGSSSLPHMHTVHGEVFNRATVVCSGAIGKSYLHSTSEQVGTQQLDERKNHRRQIDRRAED